LTLASNKTFSPASFITRSATMMDAAGGRGSVVGLCESGMTELIACAKENRGKTGLNDGRLEGRKEGKYVVHFGLREKE
jgi:hypothetical protein